MAQAVEAAAAAAITQAPSVWAAAVLVAVQGPNKYTMPMDCLLRFIASLALGGPAEQGERLHRALLARLAVIAQSPAIILTRPQAKSLRLQGVGAAVLAGRLESYLLVEAVAVRLEQA